MTLLAVKAKRVTFTSSASSGNAAASGKCVSISLQRCRSLRATTKSADFMMLSRWSMIRKSVKRFSEKIMLKK